MGNSIFDSTFNIGMKKFFVFIVFFVIFWGNMGFAGTTRWQTLTPGVAYARIYPTPDFPLGAIHAFKINLLKYHPVLAFNNYNLFHFSLIRDLVIENNALIGINGGFFNPDFTPLGLRIQNGLEQSPIKHISWWGVFYIKNNKAHIVSQKQFQKTHDIPFAIQSGPRLVINGKIPRLKPGWSFRSALGIASDGSLIIAITDHLPMTTQTFAGILGRAESSGGLGCINAINLDGGSSSQLYAQINNFSLEIPSFAPIADVILIVPNP